MTEKTIKEQKIEEEFGSQIQMWIESRMVEKLFTSFLEDVQDAVLDEIKHPGNEDDAELVIDLIMEKMAGYYFKRENRPTPTIDEI